MYLYFSTVKAVNLSERIAGNCAFIETRALILFVLPEVSAVPVWVLFLFSVHWAQGKLQEFCCV